MHFSSGLTLENRQPCEVVTVHPDLETDGCPETLKPLVSVDAIHDGACIPQAFASSSALKLDELERTFINERDWGAGLVAQHLAAALHLPHYFRVNTARALMDFGRFPGVTQKSASHMDRMAINYPFSEVLNHEQKRAVLLEHYDEISRRLEGALTTAKLKIGIHTYDKRNPSASRRPEVSIITRPYGHQHLEANPIPAFDPLCPFKVVECTADRLLSARLGLELERAGIHTADNFPYSLPEGSVEVRAQVWFFFQYVRQIYEASERAKKLGASKAAQNLVWKMLLDTNLRSAQSDTLRHFLHAFRTPPSERSSLYFEAREFYQDLSEFVSARREQLLIDFDFDRGRPNTILIEVRKDLVWKFEGGIPQGPRLENARQIARILSAAIIKYLKNDLVHRDSFVDASVP